MNDVTRALSHVMEARSECRTQLVADNHQQHPGGQKEALLNVYEQLGQVTDLLVQVQNQPSYAEPSLPANTTVHKHEGFICTGVCCPKPSLHQDLNHKINAIKVVRNTNISPAYEYGGTEPKTRLGLKDCKDIIDALDAAGMLRVK